MKIVEKASMDAQMRADHREAERYALMMSEILLDIEELDPVNCPPDRRIRLGDREAWIYVHGNICELIYVRTRADSC